MTAQEQILGTLARVYRAGQEPGVTAIGDNRANEAPKGVTAAGDDRANEAAT